MTILNSQQAAHILRVVLQHVKNDLEANPQFTLANLITLMAVMENPEGTQPDLFNILHLEDTDGPVLSRQLRYLQGKRQGVVQSPLKPVVELSRNDEDSRINDVRLTKQGEEFAAGVARTLNRLLKAAAKS
jgi:DNA-binding MarR family transcriptional regulator